MSQTILFLSVPLLLLICICNITPEKHLHLPSYVVPCSKSAEDFDECSRQHGQEALSFITKGDKNYGIPLLSPLVLPSLKLDIAGLKLTFNDLHIYGLDTLELKKLKFDLNMNELTVDSYTDKVDLIGKYDMDGQLLVLQITGKGNMNVTITGLDIHYRVNYKLEEKDGDVYIVIPNKADVDYTMTRVYFEFDDLFGGNKQLSDATLKALNDDWDQFMEVLKPVIIETIVSIVESIAGGVTSNVPLKYLFLD
ncbi:circadian clock-controlled protein-like [Anoplophora glabripennis]|uniref:circadian clock-controlled protein-like n=1 Tax=Anoplophora glabripennis TaxID=217634 RepID=UPI00087447AF|nr:circadian clock-controlled protein-like [Anoplophora glabripennis]